MSKTIKIDLQKGTCADCGKETYIGAAGICLRCAKKANMGARIVCKHCGEPADAHCVFEPKVMPAGCVCDPMEWDDDVKDICEAYEPGGGPGSSCFNCEHDEACHAEGRP